MLSVGRIGAGDGYRYLTDQVASQDTPHLGEELLGYYERTGYPPGHWLGAGAEAFGLVGVVDETSMDRLFGCCADPRTGDQLGRRMAVHRTAEERVADRIGALDHVPSDEERVVIEAEEIARGTPQAVAGFDLTFSAPKSVSVLFALGDAETQLAVRAAHDAAWNTAYEYFEAEVAATRVGASGVAQVDVKGVTAAAFEHWYSRAGDPQLHTHVATSVMVQANDGRWRRIDSRALYRAAAATGERYTAQLMTEMTKRLGVGWVHRTSGRSTTLVPEVAGVDAGLIKAFSRRSVAINDGLASLVADYKSSHGYAPDRATLATLAQQATLSSRPAGAHRSLGESRPTWASEAAQLLGCRPEAVAEHLAQALRKGEHRGARPHEMRKPKLARQVSLTLGRLEETGATWSGWDLRREATAQLREAGFVASPAAVERVVRALVGSPSSVKITQPGEAEEVPTSLRRADGSSIFARRNEERYTSTRILDAEAALIALARIRRLEAPERARRAAAEFGEISDDVLVTTLAAAKGQVSALALRLDGAHRAAADAQDALALADAALAGQLGAPGPALRLVRARQAAADTAADRITAIDTALARRAVRPGARAERQALEAERAVLLGEHPRATESPAARSRRFEAAAAGAERADQAGRRAALSARRDAAKALDKANGEVRVARAQLREQSQGAAAITNELAKRQAYPGRINMGDYLGDLGPDQAGAVVRLADPSRPLDALIGPGGSGKTTALAQLVKAFVEGGRGVHVLAPTAVGAAELGESVDAPYATLDSAIGAWKRGLGVPEHGDLVLIDEASMGTTPKLVEAAKIATSRGALVRLIGDPRQLKAVGAGGGLALVAEAAESPELTELRRFTHAWEATATLGLRRGDPKALDAYFERDRVVGALDAVALQEVFAAWWDSAVGRASTVMVASDNANVRVLNTLARSALVEEGEVTPEGVELHDGCLAGVGDLVTTRHNERSIATRRNPGRDAYVRNHDRWRVDQLGADGSLTVTHLRRGWQVTLPADYVATHVEPAYADTGHAVQGRTVDRAEVLVKPSDSRWFLYVAMSRARSGSVAHVVVDEVQEEAAGYHPSHGPREVLEAVLARDEAVSVRDWVRAAEAARTDPALIADRYRTGGAEELRLRLATAVGDPALLVGEDAWQVLAAAEAAEAAGLDASSIAVGAPASSPAQLVEALELARFSGSDPLGRARGLAPLAGVLPAPGAQVAPDVAAWQRGLAARLDNWRIDLAKRLAAGEKAPQWAAQLGSPPKDPETRATWADAVAQVALYRATHHVEGDSLLGPRVALGSPGSVARLRATRASALAEELTGRTGPVSPTQTPALAAHSFGPSALRVIPSESRPTAPKPPRLAP